MIDDRTLEALLRARGQVDAQRLLAARRQQESGDPRSLAELLLAARWLSPEELRSIQSELQSGVGGYQLLDRLGAGGAGQVYRARDGSGAEVAIKLLHRGKPEALARFDRERRVMDELAAEGGFVRLIDHGICGQGPYIVMELMAGGSLAELLEREPLLEVEETRRIIRAAARAAGRAHARGIVHRDLKPANILFDDQDRPRIADLGVAKHFLRDRLEDRRSISLTAEGSALGTLAYMAPEQFENARAVGPAADVYALGAIAYACLTGVQAYGDGHWASLAYKASSGDFTPVRELRPECPRRLARLIAACLAPNPAQRPSDGAALAAALESSPRRLRAPLIAVLGLVAALVSGAILAGAWPEDPPPPPPVRSLIKKAEAPVQKTIPAVEPPPLIETAEVDLSDAGRARWLGGGLDLAAVLSNDVGKLPSSVSDARLSPDGSSIVVLDRDGLISLWDSRTGRERRLIRKGFRGARELAVRGDGQVAFIGRMNLPSDPPPGARSPLVRALDLRSGAVLNELRGPSAAARLALMPERGELLIGGQRSVQAWDLERFGATRMISSAPSRTALFAAEGKIILADIDSRLTLVQASDGRVLDRGALPSPACAIALLAPNRLLVGDTTGGLSEWSLSPLRSLRRIEAAARSPSGPGPRMVRRLAVDRERERSFAAIQDRIEVYQDGERRALCEPNKLLTALDLSKDGQTLISGDLPGTLRRWDPNSGQELWKRRGPTGRITALAVSPDGRFLAAAGFSTQLYLWDLNRGRELWSRPRSRAPISLLAFTPDSEGVVLVSSVPPRRGAKATTTIERFTIAGERADELRFFDDGVARDIGFGTSRRTQRLRLFIGLSSGVAVNWTLGTRELRTQEVSSKGIIGLRLIGDRGWLIDVNGQGIVVNDKGENQAINLRPPGPLSALRIDAAGVTIAYASANKVYSQGAGSARRELWGAELINALAISEDGSLVAASGPESELRVFKADGEELAAIPREFGDAAMALVFEPDGRHLIAGTRRGLVLRYALPD